MPCTTALLSRWSSGSPRRSSTALSSAVSPPDTLRPHPLPLAVRDVAQQPREAAEHGRDRQQADAHDDRLEPLHRLLQRDDGAVEIAELFDRLAAPRHPAIGLHQRRVLDQPFAQDLQQGVEPAEVDPHDAARGLRLRTRPRRGGRPAGGPPPQRARSPLTPAPAPPPRTRGSGERHRPSRPTAPAPPAGCRRRRGAPPSARSGARRRGPGARRRPPARGPAPASESAPSSRSCPSRCGACPSPTRAGRRPRRRYAIGAPARRTCRPPALRAEGTRRRSRR